MTRPVLLDTCAVIFAAEDQLSPQAVELLNELSGERDAALLSPITGWELGLLFARGRLRSSISPERYLKRLMNLPGTALAEMTPEILFESSFLPGTPPRDPADRIIAATARAHGYTVMTRDRALLDYAREGYLNAVEC